MEEFEKLIEERRSIQLAKRHLTHLRFRLLEERELLAELRAMLNKEYGDVRNLEKLSLKNLFHLLLGNKEEQYEMEKQEHLLAALKYNEARKTVELLEYEKSVIEKKVSKETPIRVRITQLIEERTEAVANKFPEIKNELLSLDYQFDQTLGYKRELHEAVIVGLKAQEILGKMIQLIRRANLGDWEPDYQYIQESKNQNNSMVDEVHEMSYRAKLLLQEFEEELEDIYAYKAIKRIEKFEEFQHFNSIYFDRLMSGWLVKEGLSGVLNFFMGTQVSIKRVVETLKIQLKKTEHQLKYLKIRKKEVVLEHLGDGSSQSG